MKVLTYTKWSFRSVMPLKSHDETTCDDLCRTQISYRTFPVLHKRHLVVPQRSKVLSRVYPLNLQWWPGVAKTQHVAIGKLNINFRRHSLLTIKYRLALLKATLLYTAFYAASEHVVIGAKDRP